MDGVGVFPSAIYGRVGRGAKEVRGMNVRLVKELGDKAVHGKYEGKDMMPHVTSPHFATCDIDLSSPKQGRWHRNG